MKQNCSATTQRAHFCSSMFLVDGAVMERLELYHISFILMIIYFELSSGFERLVENAF